MNSVLLSVAVFIKQAEDRAKDQGISVEDGKVSTAFKLSCSCFCVLLSLYLTLYVLYCCFCVSMFSLYLTLYALYCYFCVIVVLVFNPFPPVLLRIPSALKSVTARNNLFSFLVNMALQMFVTSCFFKIPMQAKVPVNM